MEFSHGLAQWDFNTPRQISETFSYPRSMITDHWFLKEAKDTTPALEITRLLNIINHLYSLKEYDQCLDYIHKGLDMNYSKKNEFLEIKARVFKQMGRLDDALQTCDLIKRNDPSITYLKGQLHFGLRNYFESLSCFLDYLLSRTDDCFAWDEMAMIASEISIKFKEFHQISSLDWTRLSWIMSCIADNIYNRPNSCGGELYELSKSKRISRKSSSECLNSKEIDSTISLLSNVMEGLGDMMRKSCLQLSIIEVS